MSGSLSEHRIVGGASLSPLVRALCADGALLATYGFVGALFIVSPLLLEHFGVSYITPGGGPASKVHPATFLAVLAVTLRCLATLHPLAMAGRLMLRESGIVMLLAATAIAALYAAAISHTPVTPVIDTFVLPVLCLVLLRGLNPTDRRRLAYFVIAFFCVNAAMAIVELFRGTHFITLPIGDDVSSDPTRSDTVFDWRAEINLDWRAIALLGHPLVNGMEVATFMICLGARGAGWLPPFVRVPVIALQLVAMGAFGARASLVLAAATLAVFAVRAVVERRRDGRRLSPRLLAIGMVVAALALIGMALLYQSGLFDRLIERFADDAGSARTRLTMLDLFTPFSWSDLLLGPDQDVVATWQRLYGLEFGIESSWIGLALTYGLVVTAIVIAGLAAFVRSVLRSSGQGAFAAIAVFLACSSVMASMSGKTISFGMAVVIVLLLLPKRDGRHPRDLPRIGTSPAGASQTSVSFRDRLGRVSRGRIFACGEIAFQSGWRSMMFRDLYARYDEDRSRPRADVEDMSAKPEAKPMRAGIGAILWRRRGTVATAVALCCVAGVLYILVTPARYLASTSMLIDPRLGKSVGADPVQPGFIVDVGAIDSQIKLFTSQTVLARVAKMADLTNDPEFNGSQRSLLRRILHPATQLEGGVDLKTLEDAITIKRPERTYVVGIDVLAQDPKKAAEIANDLTQAYIEDQVGSRIDAAREDTRFVRQQLSKLSAQIKDAEDKVEAFKAKNNIVDTTGLRSNEQQVADLTKALGEARARTSDAQARLDEVRRMKQQGHLDGTGDALKSLTIERLRQQEAEAEQNVAKLEMTLGARHPELREAEGRRTRLAGLIQDELSRVAYSAEADYQAARNNEKQIEATVERLKIESTKISAELVPLGQLERNVAVLRGSFERFAQVRDNLSQQEADSPPGRVIAVARPPVSAESPKKSVVALASVVAGLFTGLAAALLGEGTPAGAAPEEPRPVRHASRASVVPRRYWDDDEATLG